MIPESILGHSQGSKGGHSHSGNSSPAPPTLPAWNSLPKRNWEDLGSAAMGTARGGTFPGLAWEHPKSTFPSGLELLAGEAGGIPAFLGGGSWQWHAGNVRNARSVPDGNQAPPSLAGASLFQPQGFYGTNKSMDFSRPSGCGSSTGNGFAMKSWSRDFLRGHGLLAPVVIPKSHLELLQEQLPNPAP